MDNSVIKNIIEITLMLLAYAQVFDFYWAKYEASGMLRYKTGAIISSGIIGIVLMIFNISWLEHIRLDTRTVLLCLMGLTAGKGPTMIVTGIMASASLAMYTITWQERSLELTYMLGAAMSGLIFAHINPKWADESKLITIIHATYIAQAIQYICIALMPSENTAELLKETILPVLVMMPLSVLGLSNLIISRARSWKLDKQLRDSEDKFKKIAICSQDCIWEMDSKGRIIHASDNLKSILGYDAKELKGQQAFMLTDDTDTINALTDYIHCKDSSAIFENDLVMRHKKGHKIYCSARGIKIIDEHSGILNGYIGIIHNITDQHLHDELVRHNEKTIREQSLQFQKQNKTLNDQIERLKKTNKDLEDDRNKTKEELTSQLSFISTLSNELTSSLKDISNYTTRLMDNNEPETDRKNLMALTNSSSNYLLTLINDINDADKLARGIMKLNISIGSIEELMIEIYDHYNSRNLYVNKKSIVLKTTVDLPMDEVVIKTDFTRLKQILSDLINNSYNFTTMGKITVECRKYNEKELIFTVSDTGPGIPEAAFSSIFTPYNKKRHQILSVPELEHTGLSLSICKSIVEMMGGKIWLDSEIGKGTRFHFTIPYVQASEIAQREMVSYNWQNKSALVLGCSQLSNIKICEALLKTSIRYRNILIDDKGQAADYSSYFDHYDIMIIDQNLMTHSVAISLMSKYVNTPVIITSEDTQISSLYKEIDNKLYI